MFAKVINVITALTNVTIRKSTTGFVSGKITTAENNEVKFKLSWGDNYVYLQLKKDEPKFLEALSKEIGKPFMKCHIRGWLGKRVVYFWENDPKRKEELFKSMQFGIAMKSVLFSFMGWQSAELIAP